MSSAVIPANVAATAVQYQVFSNEIYYEILKHLLVLPDSTTGKMMRFLILNGRFSKMLRVSKNFASAARAAFYNVNLIILEMSETRYTYIRKFSTEPALLPPPQFNSMLRRIRIDIRLEDYFYSIVPNNKSGPEAGYDSVLTPIVTVQQLFANCAGARQLRDLTHAVHGFNRLEVLDLRLHDRFLCNLCHSLVVYRNAGFTVSAKQVNIEVIQRPEHADNDKPIWYPRLVKTIKVQ